MQRHLFLLLVKPKRDLIYFEKYLIRFDVVNVVAKIILKLENPNNWRQLSSLFYFSQMQSPTWYGTTVCIPLIKYYFLKWFRFGSKLAHPHLLIVDSSV